MGSKLNTAMKVVWLEIKIECVLNKVTLNHKWHNDNSNFSQSRYFRPCDTKFHKMIGS